MRLEKLWKMLFDKIKRFVMSAYYSLPFGMKGANSEIMGNGTQDMAGVEISQEVSDERVAKHLLKGEVTQEVEELRYRTYKVSNESEKYKYLGGGVAVKEDAKGNGDRTRFKFSQDNENICESVLNSLKQVGSTGSERYRFEIDYSEFVRFKVEKFAKSVDVDIDDNNKKIETTLHFSSEPNPYDASSMPFINELGRLFAAKNEYEISRNEIASTIKNFSFVTYKAVNEESFVTYNFINGGKFKSIRKENYEYLLTLSWEEYMRMPMNLEVKYYSKSMADKYEKNERKETAVSVGNVNRKVYCSVCGREMELYDHDIQMANGSQPVCKECMKKTMR